MRGIKPAPNIIAVFLLAEISHILIERHLCLIEISIFKNVYFVYRQWIDKMSNFHLCEAPVLFCFAFAFLRGGGGGGCDHYN